MFKNYDTLIIFGEDSRFYFSSFESSFGCVIITENSKILITDKRYELEAKRKVDGFTIVCSTSSDFYNEIQKQLEKLSSKIVGFESDVLTVDQYNDLTSNVKGVEFIDASYDINYLRSIKTEKEVNIIEKAEQITTHALQNAIYDLKVGITEKEFSDLITYNMLKLGAQDKAFDNIVCFGETSAVPHHKPDPEVVLKKDDIILVDIGAKYNGYCADMTRTFCLGNPNPALANIFQIVLDAQEFALANIKAGLTCGEVDGMAREYILAHGYKEEFSHSLGHGVGVQIHEFPFVSPKSDVVLKENMIISVEPGIYIEGLGGVRIEDLVVIKNDGIVNLTKLSKELKI